MGNAKIIPANQDVYFLPFQAAWINDNSRLKLIEKSRQIGITDSTAARITLLTGSINAAYDFWVSSRDDLQAKLFIDDCKKYLEFTEFLAGNETIIKENKKPSAYVLPFANNYKIHSLSSNPDAQAGKRGGRVLDEFALHPDPKKLWAITYPGITWGGTLEIISTHRGSHNFFNELIEEITQKDNPKNISHHKITLQNALDQGFLFKLQKALPEGDERQAMDEQAYFDFIRTGCADEESFQQEYMCNPANDDAAFLEYNLIASCEYPENEQWQKDNSAGTLVAGIDIGRKHDLTVIWVLELIGDVWHTRQVETMENMSKSEQEKVLYPIMERCFRVCIDYTGLGIGWGDDMVDHFGEYHTEKVVFTNKTKELLAYPVRNAFEQRKIRIPFDPKIRSDLRSVTKQTTAAGNIRFTAERRPDGHADRFWSLALAIHASSSHMGKSEFINVSNSASLRRVMY